MQVPIEVQRRGNKAVEIYVGCIERGESVLLAEMLAMQQAPRGMTDDVFFSGIGTLDTQFSGGDGPSQLNHLVSEAKRHGYNPNYNDYYCDSIAAFPGDPKAFIPRSGGRAHAKQVLEERGWGTADGSAVSVKQRAPEVDPHASVDLSQDKGKKE